MIHTREEQMQSFGRLLDILDELRVKCPWDKKQTNESLRPNTIEEVYELCDALMKNDEKNICKELGDVLLHVVFYAKIGSESGYFDIKDVCDRLCDKLIFRHPHVFGSLQVDTAEKVSENWEQIKLKEKDGNKTVLSGVPQALPSLIKAESSVVPCHDSFLFCSCDSRFNDSARSESCILCLLSCSLRCSSLCLWSASDRKSLSRCSLSACAFSCDSRSRRSVSCRSAKGCSCRSYSFF